MRLLAASFTLLTASCGGIAVPAPQVAPRQEGVRTTVDVAPKGNPGYSGSYDFELLGPIEGSACVDPAVEGTPYASLLGVAYSTDPLQMRAEGAAAFEALNRLPAGADTILVTRVKSVQEGPKMCATIAGRAVRLIKSAEPAREPPPVPAPPPPPPPAPAATK